MITHVFGIPLGHLVCRDNKCALFRGKSSIYITCIVLHVTIRETQSEDTLVRHDHKAV